MEEKTDLDSNSPSSRNEQEHNEHKPVDQINAFQKGGSSGRGIFDFDDKNLSGKWVALKIAGRADSLLNTLIQIRESSCRRFKAQAARGSKHIPDLF